MIRVPVDVIFKQYGNLLPWPGYELMPRLSCPSPGLGMTSCKVFVIIF